MLARFPCAAARQRARSLGARSRALTALARREFASHGELDRDHFRAVFEDVLDNVTAEEREEAILAVDRLFDTFDQDGNGTVDAREFFTGVTVLCAGEGDDRTHMAFALYDAEFVPPPPLARPAFHAAAALLGSGDGYISPPEMEQYLTAVFRTMLHTSPNLFAQHGCVPPPGAATPRASRSPRYAV